MVHTEDQLNQVIAEYVTKTVDRIPQVEEIWLFGSHIHGTPHEDSDIDLAVVSPLFADDFPAALGAMYLTLWKMENRAIIEIHGFTREDFDADLLGEEVRRTGKKIYPIV